MKRVARVVGLVSGLWAGSTVLCAQTSSGPLQSTQQELKALQSKQSDRSVPKEAPRTSLPTLQFTDPNAAPLEIPNPRKMEKDQSKQKDARKNWLVDGVQQLEKMDRSRSDPNGKGPVVEMPTEKKNGEPAAPQSLLEVYADQQKQADESKRDQKFIASARAGNDPLAPFLQNWMGNSPASGKFFDEFAGKSAASAQTDAVGLSVTSTATVSVESTRPTVAESFDHTKSGGGSNPYLTGLDSPGMRTVTQPAISASSPSPTSDGLTGFLPTVPSNLPPIDRPTNDRKAPLSTPSDDKKYFPQLKKF